MDEICILQNKREYRNFYNALDTENPQTKKLVENRLSSCWHIVHFHDRKQQDNDTFLVRKLAYRMNEAIAKAWQPKGFFTGRQLSQFLEKQISYFGGLKISDEELHAESPRAKLEQESIAINFGLRNVDSTSYICKTNHIEIGKNDKVIRRAVAIESISEKAFLLYRQGDLSTDRKMSEKDLQSNSLSFGTSPFAGSMRDGGATPFYIPPGNSICQLSSRGEFFHARTKLPKEAAMDDSVKGIYWPAVKKLKKPTVPYQDFLRFSGSAEELKQSFDLFLKSAWTLKE